MSKVRAFLEQWRPSAVTGGMSTFPLMVLFGLNAVDELDRVAFAILLPTIRDAFGLGDTGILTVVAASTVVILFLEIPLAHFADRAARVRIATYGALAWALFAFGTGLAWTVVILVLMRIGSGLGRSVNTPTHGPLLSDYYPPDNRVKVFGFHRMANSVGQIVGPLAAGTLAYFFGWRVPFLVLAIPTLFLVYQASKLEEPERGATETRDDAVAVDEGSHIGFRDAFGMLKQVPTLRRIWMAIPFLAVALFGVPNLLALIYEDIYGFDELDRGIIAAAIEPAQLIGAVLFLPYANRLVRNNPAGLLRLIAFAGVACGCFVTGIAYAPNSAVAIGMNVAVSGTIGVLAPAVFALLSLVIPPQVRSLGFSIVSVFGIPGIAVALPLIGFLSDNYGQRIATVTLVPVMVVAGLIMASAHRTISADIARSGGDASLPFPDPLDAMANDAPIADVQLVERVEAGDPFQPAPIDAGTEPDRR